MNTFQHYYLFAVLEDSNILDLKKRYGNYKKLEEAKETITKIVITNFQKIHFVKNKFRLISPFNTIWRGLAQINNNQDTIIVIANPIQREVELFIGEGNKNISDILFHLNETSDKAIEQLRQKSQVIASY